MIDLDDLDQKHAAATPGEWRLANDAGEVFAKPDWERVGVRHARTWASENKDIECAVTLHNAWPEVSEELKAKRNQVENLEQVLATLNSQVSEMLTFLGLDTSVESGVPSDTWSLRDALIARDAELQALREVARVAREAVFDMAPSEAYVYYTAQREALAEALHKVPPFKTIEVKWTLSM